MSFNNSSNKSARLFIYELVDDNYIKYLHSFDAHIHKPDNTIYVKAVKYIGKMNLNTSNSLIPLSSDKKGRHINAPSGLIYVEKLTYINQATNEFRYFGILRIGNQIPILNNSLIKPINFKKLHIADPKYSDLLILELDAINKHRDIILQKANESIKHTSTTYMDISNYALLEEAAKAYDPNNLLVKFRITAYPKVFSSEENDIFFKAVFTK